MAAATCAGGTPLLSASPNADRPAGSTGRFSASRYNASKKLSLFPPWIRKYSAEPANVASRGRRMPSIEVVRQLAVALKTTMTSLIEELEEPED
jgi:hypothetical protein